MSSPADPWDEFADEYARVLVERGPVKVDDGGIIARLIDLLGNLEGKVALDAGCGEGLLFRSWRNGEPG